MTHATKSHHAKEPWKFRVEKENFRGPHNHSEISTDKKDGNETCVVQCIYEEENAKRIVDCVNACAGMEDPIREVEALKTVLAGLLKHQNPNEVRSPFHYNWCIRAQVILKKTGGFK